MLAIRVPQGRPAALGSAVRVGAQALIVVAIAWVVADTAMFLLAGPAEAPVSSLEPGDAVPEEQFPAFEIASWELFGSAEGNAGNGDSASEATEGLATTGLSLVLVGVFVADESQASAALVAQPNRKAKRYRIGDRLPGRAILEAVYRDRVVIRRGGVRELIRFPEPKERFAVASRSGDLAVSSATPAAAPSPAPLSPGSSPPPRSRPPMPEGDPASILYDAGLTPVKPGAAEGYALGELAANPVLRQAGLRPGDRILSVNGRAVGNVELDQAQFESVMAAGTARIEVQRGGRRWFVTVSM